MSNFLDFVRKEIQKKESKTNRFSFGSLNTPIKSPTIKEYAGKDYIYWGEDNLYPQFLKELRGGSAIHNAIIKTKSKMMAGNGLLFNGSLTKEDSLNVLNSLNVKDKAEVLFLMNNENGNGTLEQVNEWMAEDYQTYGELAYKIIFNNNFTKIAGIQYIKAENLRAGKEVDGKVTEYWYSKDWSNISKNKPHKIAAYDKDNKENLEQLRFIKAGKQDYYGEPLYQGAINWINIDLQMAVFHKSNIENGMNPGLHFKFYKEPESDEAEAIIRSRLRSDWRGASNAGKEFVTFSPSKEEAMDIQPINVSGLDKQLIHLAELCDKKILSGHQLTTPLLAGISISGSLGGNTELETGYNIFDGLSMAADRKVLARENQFIFSYNTGVKVDINKFKPF